MEWERLEEFTPLTLTVYVPAGTEALAVRVRSLDWVGVTGFTERELLVVLIPFAWLNTFTPELFVILDINSLTGAAVPVTRVVSMLFVTVPPAVMYLFPPF